MHRASFIIPILSIIASVSCQVLHFTEPRQSPFVTRLNVPHQQQVPAFVITSIDQGWKEQSRGADPKEQRVPVLIASNPSYTRSQYQYEHPQDQVPKPAASSPDYDVTEDEANDPRFKFLYEALSKQYSAKYEAAAAEANTTPASPATEEPATTPSTTTTTTTESTTTTTAAPSTPVPTEAPAPKEETLHSIPSYQSVSSVPSYRANYPQPAPRPISAYDPVKAVHKGVASKYVPSDVFTIEQTTNYRPRYFHSDAIFYQKALAFLRDYKDSVLNNREHGLTYRPNSETDDPTHVTNAYDELTPVIVRDRQVPLVPKELLKPVAYSELHDKPQAVTYDEHPVAAEEKQLVGFLPVIALPKKSPRQYPIQSSYSLLSSLAAQESVPTSVSRKPSAIIAATTSNPESKPSASGASIPTISILKPQSYRMPEYEHTVPFLKVIKKH